MLPTRLDTTAIFGEEDLRILGKSACVRRRGPKVFTAKVFCRADKSTVCSVSFSGLSITPATCRRRSIGVSAPRDWVKEWIESGEETSSWWVGQGREVRVGLRVWSVARTV